MPQTSIKGPLVLAALGCLNGALIGTLPLTMNYSAGRGWLNPGYVLAWPAVIGVSTIVLGVLLAKRSHRLGLRAMTVSLVAMVAVELLVLASAFSASPIDYFMKGFQDAVENRIKPDEFHRWAETVARQFSAQTNSPPSWKILPGGLAEIFPRKPRVLIEQVGNERNSPVSVRIAWGGGFWHWGIDYVSNREPTFGQSDGLVIRDLGHGMRLTSD